MDEKIVEEHMIKIAALENEVHMHNEEIIAMRKRMHDLADSVTVLLSTFKRLEQVNQEANRRFEKHMDKEEESFRAMYSRLSSMDKELKQAFKERDDKIHKLDKDSAKVIALATGAFIAAQFILKLGFGV